MSTYFLGSGLYKTRKLSNTKRQSKNFSCTTTSTNCQKLVIGMEF